MLSHAYFLAKIRFDTAENEPAKNLQKFCKILQILPILQNVDIRGSLVCAMLSAEFGERKLGTECLVPSEIRLSLVVDILGSLVCAMCLLIKE